MNGLVGVARPLPSTIANQRWDDDQRGIEEAGDLLEEVSQKLTLQESDT